MTDQIDGFAKAKAFITNFAKSLLPDADVGFRSGRLQVERAGQHFSLPFSREDLDDLEPVLDGDLPTKYSEGMKNAIRFQICFAFFREGFTPNIKMSAFILNDKRDWLTSVRLTPHFEDDLAAKLHRGLETLELYLNQTLQKHGEIPAVRNDLTIVQSITEFYKNNKHLHSRAAERDSLSFLKAAAVLAIIELENKSDSTNSEPVKKKYQNEISSIVQVFEGTPYDQIKLPGALSDYLADNMPSKQSRVATSKSPRASHAFTDIDDLLRSVDPRLIDRRRGAWLALESENPDNVSQAASSMVEVLSQVIDFARKQTGSELKELLATKLDSEGQADWVEATRTWVVQTKNNLQRLKHHPAAQPNDFARRLMAAAELIIQVVLN
jgi:hypothetical protein